MKKKWKESRINAQNKFMNKSQTNIEILFYPKIRKISELCDIYFKCLYFLPIDLIHKIILPCSSNIDIRRPLPRLDYLMPLRNKSDQHIDILCDKQAISEEDFHRADFIFLWDFAASKDFDDDAIKNKALNIDRHTNIWDGVKWATFLWRLQKNIIIEQQRAEAQENFNLFLNNIPSYSKSYIFGTGPSLDKAFEFDFTDGYRIVCNTIVKNSELMNYIDPHFIVAADSIFHFGNNLHAYQFRKDLTNQLLNRDIRFLTNERYFPIFTHYSPMLKSKTIPLRAGLKGIHMNYRKELAYTHLHNILNSMLLPLASSLSDEIFLLGFDGRNSDDEGFWQNSDKNAYNDLKPTIVKAHPAFFKINYEDYAMTQSDSAEQVLKMGEKEGKRYFCLNKTTNRALMKRCVLAN